MSGYAMYRLPYADKYTIVRQTRGEIQQLNSLTELNGREGFIIAPFTNSAECPILLLRPDEVLYIKTEGLGIRTKGQEGTDADFKNTVIASETKQYGVINNPFVQTELLRFTCNDEAKEQALSSTCQRNSSLTRQLINLSTKGRQQYAADFARFHAQLLAGDFRKIVLSRCVRVDTARETQPKELFLRACKLYPRVFVALVSTPRSGTWLAATPEILLSGSTGKWRTIALAGTMRYDTTQEWTDKSKAEQRYVADYMKESLALFAGDITEKGPYTARAGHLIHLRSDFDFTLKDASRLGDVLQKLHPTPAVCGLPKEATRGFIIENEHCPRKYYSGFMGMLSPSGNTNLYVSLRCMCITDRSYYLYAGGGLLADSVEDEEWVETEAKTEMMKEVISNSE